MVEDGSQSVAQSDLGIVNQRVKDGHRQKREEGGTCHSPNERVSKALIIYAHFIG